MQALDTSCQTGLSLPSHSGGRDRWSRQQSAQGSSPSSPTSLDRDFGHTGTQGRSWSPSFGGSPQPRHPRAQPACRVGSRRVAGVRTIHGRSEEGDVVVEGDAASEVVFLGLKISRTGVRPETSKTDEVHLIDVKGPEGNNDDENSPDEDNLKGGDGTIGKEQEEGDGPPTKKQKVSSPGCFVF
uniref:Uncharacterized protein n=1 Tax=Chromera velia CCMP2878 TaxID=1169474 RepID=A0A0G4HS67_9ALVE|eukprot:Cvel_8190.t1-p1 / transcript=Cvel_8190.t1 / gene=Cvel_8190 / organism=Chromera_velia_CCMP2878 / gene_product=hypothetical protein / transcript_product=hypothetical protein / location=Cvel_scaffold446:52213-60161(-) / protein_length=183 / sequence_SO=supercontig / SO=protein_coding / is_pseudo=false